MSHGNNHNMNVLRTVLQISIDSYGIDAQSALNSTII